MSLEQHFLESVVDVICGAVLVGFYFIDDYSTFGVHFVFRKCGGRGDFHQQGACLVQVLLQHCRMQNYLFLGGVGVQFAAESVEITAYYRGAFVLRSLKQSMFCEMCDSAVETLL